MNKEKLKKENDYLKSILASIVWVQPSYNGSPSCSYCGHQKHWGHAEHCRLKEFDEDQLDDE